MRQARWEDLLPGLAAALVVLLVLGGVFLIDAAEGRRYAEQTTATVTIRAAAIRARVEQALNTRLFLVRSLVALVRSNPDLTQTEFEEAAAAAAEGITGVRSLALARNAVATHFYPWPATSRRSATTCWQIRTGGPPSWRSSASGAS